MDLRYNRPKLVLVLLMVVSISCATYAFHYSQLYYEYLLQALYFVPLTFSAFWFGLRGAAGMSAAIAVLYSPFVVMHWRRFKADELESLLEVVIYTVFAGVLGWLRDRDMAQQRRLRDAERLAAMGKVLSSLAHDMKTPLVAIGGFARLVLKKLPNENPDRERLAIVVKETKRLEHMVSDMLDFSVDLRLDQAEEDICRLVKESLLVVEEMASEKKIRLDSRIDQNLPRVTCDGMRVEQLLINLLTNAIDSSPEDAPVTVRAYQGDEGLVMDVIDRGPGIPSEQRRLIFDPFFTTKAHGTGLGLQIVKKIVEAHKGRIEIIDNPDRGLTFRVILPGACAVLTGGQSI